jgi:hypothetical protein
LGEKLTMMTAVSVPSSAALSMPFAFWSTEPVVEGLPLQSASPVMQAPVLKPAQDESGGQRGTAGACRAFIH